MIIHTCRNGKVTTVANAWETLIFNFANQASGTAALNTAYTYNMASIFMILIPPEMEKYFIVMTFNFYR